MKSFVVLLYFRADKMCVILILMVLANCVAFDDFSFNIKILLYFKKLPFKETFHTNNQIVHKINEFRVTEVIGSTWINQWLVIDFLFRIRAPPPFSYSIKANIARKFIQFMLQFHVNDDSSSITSEKVESLLIAQIFD